MSRRTMIDCGSCGNRMEENGTCDACVSWREENDAKIEQLEAENAELKSELVIERHNFNEAVLCNDRIKEENAKLRAALDPALLVVETLLKQQGGLTDDKTNMVFNLTGVIETLKDALNET